MKVAGVDGTRGRWVVALLELDGGGTPRVDGWDVLEAPADQDRLDVQVVAVDVPIGLPSGQEPRREVDRLAREEAGVNPSSVFPAPRREVVQQAEEGGLGFRDAYSRARGLLERLGGPSMAAQAFALVPYVRAWDQVVRQLTERGRPDRVVETHPEVVLARLRDGAGAGSKKSARGLGQRLRALDGVLGPGVAAAALEETPEGVPTDDAVDALLCAVAAVHRARGTHETLPEDPPTDAEGVPMRLVLPPRNPHH